MSFNSGGGEQTNGGSGETSSNEASNSVQNDTTNTSGDNGYSDPLGVSKTADKSSLSTDTSTTAFAAVAAASLAVIGGAAYSLAKQNKEEG